MLALKKGDYTVEELNTLYMILEGGKGCISCSSLGCDTCANKQVCADITRLEEYIIRLIAFLEDRKPNIQN